MTGIDWRSKENHLPWILFLSGLAIFISNVDLLSTGDTIYYANIIDTLRLDQLTAHQGYYVFGLIVSTGLNFFSSVPTDQALAYMSAVFGSAALTVGFLLARHYLESTSYALLTVLILFVCHRFFENSISAEVYIVQAFFLWLAILLFEKQQFYVSGIALTFSFWVTPLTLPFCLWFAVSAYLRRIGVFPLLKTALPAVVLYGLFLIIFYEELLWGNRGLLEQDEAREILFGEGLRSFGTYQFKHYTVLNLLFIPALFALKHYRYLAWTSLAIVLPNIYVISQLRSEDNVFILPLDIIFAIWIAIGFRFLIARRLKYFALAILILHAAVFIALEDLFTRPSHASFANEIQEIGQLVKSKRSSLLFAKWSQRMAFVYFNRTEPSFPLEGGYWYSKSYDMGHIQQNDAKANDFAEYAPIYVLETWGVSAHGK
ncbi:MAG: hypothetical protein OEU36_18865, partial [Gammaproteobacteria bacterium]|nr:hypothetical protein [Gammaproteobacteria bacterium]